MRRQALSEEDLTQFLAQVGRRDRSMVRRSMNNVARVIASPLPGVLLPTSSPFTLALTGKMVSGKNQIRIAVKHGKIQKYPDKTFTNWRARSYIQIMDLYRHPLTIPVHLTVDYWPSDKRTRDITGMADALFHLLVYAKVLKDDGLIRGLVWREHDLNRKFPKLVMEIRPIC